jgi:hypothetical protein
MEMKLLNLEMIEEKLLLILQKAIPNKIRFI